MVKTVCQSVQSCERWSRGSIDIPLPPLLCSNWKIAKKSGNFFHVLNVTTTVGWIYRTARGFLMDINENHLETKSNQQMITADHLLVRTRSRESVLSPYWPMYFYKHCVLLCVWAHIKIPIDKTGELELRLHWKLTPRSRLANFTKCFHLTRRCDYSYSVVRCSPDMRYEIWDMRYEIIFSNFSLVECAGQAQTGLTDND